MPLTSFGDLSTSLLLRNRSVELRREISDLSLELSSGRVADVARHLNGDTRRFSAIEADIVRLNALEDSASEARGFAESAQASLAHLHNLSGRLSQDLLMIGPSSSATAIEHASFLAETDLRSAISTLNTRVADRSLFAGVATDELPLASADDLLAALEAELLGATDAADARARADAWFDDPAGFDAVMYRGSTTSLAPFEVGQDTKVEMELRANDPTLKEYLKNVALAALSTDPSLGFPTRMRADLFQEAGERLLGSQVELTLLQADLGYVEETIENASVRTASQLSALQIARNDLVLADPFDTATRLEEAQFQMEALYAVTVKVSRLSLLQAF
jgi:flagellar hook-associated protein 3 FlgL